MIYAIGRSEVVLLSSHFERYIYGLNEEAVHVLCDSKIPVAVLPAMLKLQYTKQAIDEIAATGWEKRALALVCYSATEALLWSPQSQLVELDASRILTWMKAPDPKSLVRAFRLWGIEDIFGAITRTPVNRSRLRLKLGELVDKRNNIAHGDFTVEATYLDVTQYQAAVRDFCTRADKRLARQLASIMGRRPW